MAQVKHKPNRVIVFIDRGFVWNAISDTDVKVITVNVDKQIIHRNHVLINSEEAGKYEELAEELERAGTNINLVDGNKRAPLLDVTLIKKEA